MSLDACTSSTRPTSARSLGYLPRPHCPRCGDTLLAAESSVLVAHGHIRHAWCCEGCGNAFETAVRFSPAANLVDDLD